MNNISFKNANLKYAAGCYEDALYIYKKLAEKYGADLLKANLDSCERRLGGVSQILNLNSKSKNKQIKIAGILDEFSWICWKYEAEFIKLMPETWVEQMEEKPDLLFVESAWQGNSGAWQYKISNSKRVPARELCDLIKYCKNLGIPTVFWNKEDPVHFEHFLNAAKLFDVVCTTDENCVQKYKDALGHSNIFVLQFAAQPIIHNPSKVIGYRNKGVAFAGAWYHDQHDQRAVDSFFMLNSAKDFGLEIYDRNFNKPDLVQRHGWPDEFKKYIVGGVSYSEMVEVYKRYKVFINVNSIVDSPTMFSRRVFELLACGTPVISSFAKGIEQTFGSDVVFMPREKGEIKDWLGENLNDAKKLEKLSEVGLRLVMSRHTYGHRLASLIDHVNKFLATSLPTNLGLKKEFITEALVPVNAPLITVRDFGIKCDKSYDDKAVSRPQLRVGVIIDEIFEPYFKYEFNLIKFKPYQWGEIFGSDIPDFMFIDSAWNGNDGSWAGLINRQGTSEPSKEFRDLISWCKEMGIPTVFWSREDPPNFEVFFPTAMLCDYIYTTDLGSVVNYKKLTGRSSVGVLPFSVQPRIHNPIGSKREKEGDFIFAGTWYDNKHDSRKIQMDVILEPLLDENLHIYDRMCYFTRTRAYVFPEKFRKCIAGSLSYAEVMAVTKRYKIMLNVNSVIESPTMCSCRITESLMLGAAVISGFANGAENMIGSNFIHMPRNREETIATAKKLLSNDIEREMEVHRAQRYIMSNHLCSHRVDQILHDIGLHKFKSPSLAPLVSVLTPTNRPGNIYNIINNFQSQNWSNKELIIGVHGFKDYEPLIQHALVSSGIENFKVIYFSEDNKLGAILNRLVSEAKGAFVCRMDDDDLYFKNYISDNINCFKYTDASIIGKHSYYVHLESNDSLYIRLPGREHEYMTFVCGASIFAKKEIFDLIKFPVTSVGEDTDFLKLANKKGLRVYSSDRFNFVAKRKVSLNSHTWKIEESEYVKKLKFVTNSLDRSIIDV